MELLKILHIDRPDSVLNQYSRWDHERFCKLKKINNLIKGTGQSFQSIYGGVADEIKFKGRLFKIFTVRAPISIDLAIHSGDNLKDRIHIKIHRNDDPLMKTAYLDIRSSDPDCVELRSTYPGGGSILMNFAIFLMKNIKGVDISRLRIRDMSMYRYGLDGKRLKLALIV